jgi:hypothetical protein
MIFHTRDELRSDGDELATHLTHLCSISHRSSYFGKMLSSRRNTRDVPLSTPLCPPFFPPSICHHADVSAAPSEIKHEWYEVRVIEASLWGMVRGVVDSEAGLQAPGPCGGDGIAVVRGAGGRDVRIEPAARDRARRPALGAAARGRGVRRAGARAHAARRRTRRIPHRYVLTYLSHHTSHMLSAVQLEAVV